ncbi:alpha-ketoglutarate-dependent dioxygenase AlkB family protein [Immundisolibacter cernigliae]|uniref:alpha-ketoglutarate-dependent dioxygenase AlkB family protein n=1 Tax=Immundisolibacter cernigliae TaxID=1810504 RepID=UPI00083B16CF|nr:alpha-ketoglutarate-dependent dioxygenase AlkB [Immundisolibacter cernigliae]
MPLPDGLLYHLPQFLAPDAASVLLGQLTTSLDWQQHRLKLFGRECLTPRLCAWYGDADARYGYSGQTLEPLPWTAPLAALRQRLEAMLGLPLNGMLANLYRDGADSMGWHSDDEASLGPRPVIVSLSLGATRRFVLRHRRRRDLQTVALALEHGSLLVMAGDTQRHWQHAVPKTRRAVGVRINLTFRYVSRLRAAAGAPVGGSSTTEPARRRASILSNDR